MLQYIACCKMSIYDITNCQSAQIKNCYWKKNKEITKWLTSMGMWLLPVGNSALHTIWIMHVISYFCDFLHVQEHMWARVCKEWLQRGQWFFMWEEPSDFHMDILSLKLMKVHMSTTDLSAGKNLCFMESSFTKPWTILDPALSSSAILTSLGVLCSLVLCSCGWANHFSSET